MDIINWISEVVSSIARHGLSLTTLAVAVTALLRVNGVRRAILKRLPKRFRHADKLDRIEAKVDSIAKHLGVDICGVSGTGINGQMNSKRSSGRSPMENFRTSVRKRISQRAQSQKNKYGEERKMKLSINWVTLVVALLGAAKLVLQAFGIDVITDDMIDKASNVVAAVVTLVGVTMSHRKGEKTDDPASGLNVPIESAE